jgi:hypothetical protein
MKSTYLLHFLPTVRVPTSVGGAVRGCMALGLFLPASCGNLERAPIVDSHLAIEDGTYGKVLLKYFPALLERGESAHLPRISFCRSLASQADRQTIQSQDMAYRIKCRPLRLVYEYRDLNNVPVVKTSLEFHTVEASDGSAGRLLPVGKSIKTTVKISSNKAVR